MPMSSLTRALVGASLFTACAVAGRVKPAAAESARPAWASSPLLRASAATALSLEEAQGYTIHLFNSKEAQKDPLVKVRPLYKKTFRCRNANPWSCVECFKGPNCLSVQRDPADGSEYLYIEANGSDWKRWRHHRVRVNLHCPESAEFTIGANITIEGWMNKAGMCVDGIPAPTSGDDSRQKLRTIALTKSWHGSYSRIVEVDMHVKLRRKGFARVNDMVVHMSSDYLMCQDHTACLSVLEETSEGSTLRMSNALQLECLQGGLAGNAACEAWRRCLDKANSRDRILTLLLAAGVTKESDSKALVAQETKAVRGGGAGAVQAADGPKASGEEEEDSDEEESPASKKSSTQEPLVNTCIDPRIDDPESWLCSCMTNMENTCAAISPTFKAHYFSTQDCITAQMCLDPSGQICSTWKEDIRCNSTQFAALKAAVTDHINGNSPAASVALAQAQSSPPAQASTALFARAQQRASRAGASSRMVDSSLKGKSSVCENR